MFFGLNVIAAAAAIGNLTAGTNGSAWGYIRGDIGTLNPNVFKGVDIDALRTADGAFWFEMAANTPDTDASWISCTIKGVFVQGSGEINVLRSGATLYIADFLGSASWSYTGGDEPGLDFVDGNQYTVFIL